MIFVSSLYRDAVLENNAMSLLDKHLVGEISDVLGDTKDTAHHVLCSIVFQDHQVG